MAVRLSSPVVPYRDTRIEAPVAKPETGIVDDMVRQFADRYAFLRELVQNGIDAGATKIEVRIDQDGEGFARTSVEDDGKGMSRAIIDGPLLTLSVSSAVSQKHPVSRTTRVHCVCAPRSYARVFPNRFATFSAA